MHRSAKQLNSGVLWWTHSVVSDMYLNPTLSWYLASGEETWTRFTSCQFVRFSTGRFSSWKKSVTLMWERRWGIPAAGQWGNVRYTIHSKPSLNRTSIYRVFDLSVYLSTRHYYLCHYFVCHYYVCHYYVRHGQIVFRKQVFRPMFNETTVSMFTYRFIILLHHSVGVFN